MKARLLTLFTFLLVFASAMALAQGNPSASGNFVRSNGVQIVFNAIQHKDGSVSGSLYLDNPNNGIILTASVDELLFSADGKSAYMHGVVTSSNDAVLIGQEFIKKVTDNGHGNSGVADDDSGTWFAPYLPLSPGDIAYYLDNPDPSLSDYYPILSGNISVKPKA